MRRRQDADRVPPRLRWFDAADWPDGDPFTAWLEARREWHEVQGWPGGDEGWSTAQLEAAIQTPDEEWL
jgi:hypothetical protein